MNRIIAMVGLSLSLFASSFASAAEPYGIGLEGFAYPYPVAMLAVPGEGETLRLAYMDVKPIGPANCRSIVLLHGRNFPSSYWGPTSKALAIAAYRIVVP